jgi:hypothetical protein
MVSPLHLILDQFIFLNSGLDILFGIITLFLAIYSFRIYNLSSIRSSWLYGIGFLLLSISYFLRSGFNYFLFSQISSWKEPLSLIGLPIGLSILSVAFLCFFLAGLTTIAYTVFKLPNRKVYSLILALGIIPIVLSTNMFISLFIASAIILFAVSCAYFEEYVKNKNKITLLILLAFSFLFLSSICFIISPVGLIFYFFAHLFELASYVLIFISLASLMGKNG